MKNNNFFNRNEIGLRKRFSIVCIALMAAYSAPDYAASRAKPINELSKQVPVSVDFRLNKPPVVNSIKPTPGISGFSSCVYYPSFDDISIITEHHNLPHNPIYPQQVVALDQNTITFTEVMERGGYHVPTHTYVDEVRKSLSILQLDVNVNEGIPIMSAKTSHGTYAQQGMRSDYRALEVGFDGFIGISKFGRVNKINLNGTFTELSIAESPIPGTPITGQAIGPTNVYDLDSDGDSAYLLQHSDGFLSNPRVFRLWANGFEQELFIVDLPSHTLTAIAHFDNKTYLGGVVGGETKVLQWDGGSSFTAETVINANGRLDHLEAHNDGLVAMMRPSYTPPPGQPFNRYDGDWQGSKLFLIDQNGRSCEINLNYLWIEGQGAYPSYDNSDNTINESSSNFIDMDVVSGADGTIDIILVDSRDRLSNFPSTDTRGRLVRVKINLNNVAF